MYANATPPHSPAKPLDPAYMPSRVFHIEPGEFSEVLTMISREKKPQGASVVFTTDAQGLFNINHTNMAHTSAPPTSTGWPTFRSFFGLKPLNHTSASKTFNVPSTISLGANTTAATSPSYPKTKPTPQPIHHVLPTSSTATPIQTMDANATPPLSPAKPLDPAYMPARVFRIEPGEFDEVLTMISRETKPQGTSVAFKTDDKGLFNLVPTNMPPTNMLPTNMLPTNMPPTSAPPTRAGRPKFGSFYCLKPLKHISASKIFNIASTVSLGANTPAATSPSYSKTTVDVGPDPFRASVVHYLPPMEQRDEDRLCFSNQFANQLAKELDTPFATSCSFEDAQSITKELTAPSAPASIETRTSTLLVFGGLELQAWARTVQDAFKVLERSISQYQPYGALTDDNGASSLVALFYGDGADVEGTAMVETKFEAVIGPSNNQTVARDAIIKPDEFNHKPVDGAALVDRSAAKVKSLRTLRRAPRSGEAMPANVKIGCGTKPPIFTVLGDVSEEGRAFSSISTPAPPPRPSRSPLRPACSPLRPARSPLGIIDSNRQVGPGIVSLRTGAGCKRLPAGSSTPLNLSQSWGTDPKPLTALTIGDRFPLLL